LSKKLGEASAENAQLHQQIVNLRDQNSNYVTKLDDALAYKVRYDNIKINYERSQSQVAALETQLRELETAYQQLQNSHPNNDTALLPPPPLPFIADDLTEVENVEEEEEVLPVPTSEATTTTLSDVEENIEEVIEEATESPKDSLRARFNRWFGKG